MHQAEPDQQPAGESASRKASIVFLAAGAGVITWLLAYPFYGPLASAFFGQRGPSAGHVFALGHVIGLLLAGLALARRQSSPSRQASLLAALPGVAAGLLGLLAALAAGSTAPGSGSAWTWPLALSLLAGSGLASAAVMLRWLLLLGAQPRPEIPLAAIIFLANSFLWLVGLLLSASPSGTTRAAALLLATVALFAGSWFLAGRTGGVPLPAKTEDADDTPLSPDPAAGSPGGPTDDGEAPSGRSSPPPLPLPLPALLVFALAVYPAGGLLYRQLMPRLPADVASALGYWPYMAALWPFAFVRTPLRVGETALLLVGLGLLLRLLPFPGMGSDLLTLALVQAGLAGADLFYVGQAARLAHRHRLAGGAALAINVGVVATSGLLLDTLGLSGSPAAPWATGAALAAAFLALPYLSRALAPSWPGTTPSIGFPHPDPDGSAATGSEPAPLAAASATAANSEPSASRPRTGSHPAPEAALANLTQTEQAVLSLLVRGRTYKEVSRELLMSVNTVKFHVKNIYAKLGVSSRHELFLFCGPAPSAQAPHRIESAAPAEPLRLADPPARAESPATGPEPRAAAEPGGEA
jgi:DNA-binding CsgD family transcriptional regulator